MDPFSQAALGALSARAVTPARVAGPVLLWGAAAGAMPDVDVLFSIGGSFFDALVTHRGITHSLFFAPVAGPLLGWLFWRWRIYRAAPGVQQSDLRWWVLATTAAVLSHPLLDYTTTYGTQLLQPFSDARFSSFAMPIIDPLYTAMLLLFILLARYSKHTVVMGWLGLTLGGLYIGQAWWTNETAIRFARADLETRGVHAERVGAFPTILQTALRRVVARTDGRDYVGYVSLWHPCAIQWGEADHDAAALKATLVNAEARIFDWFTMDWTHASRMPESPRVVALADLRYGATIDPRSSLFAVEARAESEASWSVVPIRRGASPGALDLGGLLAQAFPADCSLPGTARLRVGSG